MEAQTGNLGRVWCFKIILKLQRLVRQLTDRELDGMRSSKTGEKHHQAEHGSTRKSHGDNQLERSDGKVK